MKIFTYLLIVIALALLIFNVTKIDVSNPFLGDSSTALVGVLAAGCAILLVLILNISEKIKKKSKKR